MATSHTRTRAALAVTGVVLLLLAATPALALGQTTAISAQDATVNALLAQDGGVPALQAEVRPQLSAPNPVDDAEIAKAESDPQLADQLVADAATDPALAAQLLIRAGKITTTTAVSGASLPPAPQPALALEAVTPYTTRCYGGVLSRSTYSVFGITVAWDQAAATGWCSNGSGITQVSWAFPTYAASGYCWRSIYDAHGPDYSFPFSGPYATVDHAIAHDVIGFGVPDQGCVISYATLDAPLRIWYDG